MEIDLISTLFTYGPAGIIMGVGLTLLVMSRTKKTSSNGKSHDSPCPALLQSEQHQRSKIDRMANQIDRLDDKIDMILSKVGK